MGTTFFAAFILTFAIALITRQMQSPIAVQATTLSVGDTAPDFSLLNCLKEKTDPPITLSALLKNGPVALIFISNMACPPCMQHLAELSTHDAEFKAAGLQLVAIGPDPVGSEARDNLLSFPNLPILFLSDQSDQTAKAYGLRQPGGMIMEGTFVVGKARKLFFANPSDGPSGEATELLAAAKSAAAAP